MNDDIDSIKRKDDEDNDDDLRKEKKMWMMWILISKLQKILMMIYKNWIIWNIISFHINLYEMI